MASILFKKASSIVYENSWRLVCSAGENVARLFDIYELELKKLIIKPSRHSLLMKQVLQSCTRHSELVNMRGKVEVESLKLAERGNPITVVTSMNATGTYIPPWIVFQRKNMRKELMDGARTGSISASYPSVWTRTDIFTKLCYHFFFTSLNLRHMILSCWLLIIIHTPEM